MAYYNKFVNRNSTFHNIPPPPPPPSIYIPPAVTDEQFVKQFEKLNTKVAKPKVSITEARQKIRTLVQMLNELQEQQTQLSANLNNLSDEQWSSVVSMMEENKIKINEILSLLNDRCLENMRKALAKRSTKRLRLQRLNSERKKQKQEMVRAREEKSRRIDENLQKIKDEIIKVKLDEEAKLAADSVLRDTLRKKHDARKCIVKLEALMRLRRARRNTARGRGEQCSEADEADFNNNIEKLISLWKGKLSAYELEEKGLRERLNKSQPVADEVEGGGALAVWRDLMFAGEPQVDFQGDIGGFLAIRAEWDQCISSDGTPLPIGWVVPEPSTEPYLSN